MEASESLDAAIFNLSPRNHKTPLNGGV
ncbi:hypothetical protein CCACVL1_16088 [Corchorus capsularis]|uniref:Uncharacterized protein n=1 Tax=Corchorus capsularis TaxID=210143 RepID=A0A1R3HZ83_COCAP|nr:hypothetical protein CCACVL1_16088 [Corchorus capsularis]